MSTIGTRAPIGKGSVGEGSVPFSGRNFLAARADRKLHDREILMGNASGAGTYQNFMLSRRKFQPEFAAMKNWEAEA